jgi:anti-anti-sigma factor
MDVLPEQLFVVRVAPGDGTVRVTVAGDLDANSAASFRALAALPPGGVRRLELDLAQVTFLDAAGAREILRLRRAVLLGGGRLVIVATSDAANVVLGVASLGAGLGQAGGA